MDRSAFTALVLALAVLAEACGGSPIADASDSGSPDAGDAGTSLSDAGAEDSGVAGGVDAGSDGGTAELKGTLSGTIRVDNFGWRPADEKMAVVLGQAHAAAQLIDVESGAVVGQYTSSSPAHTDTYSGDSYSIIDFSTAVTPGDYYLYLPSLDIRSYRFRIADDVYDVVGAAAVKSYYFQRCNHDKALPYASDALAGFAGLGGQWIDGACHTTDYHAPAGPGSADHGLLDVHGGWHDAGDYQKTLWGRGVSQLLFAYEVNPTAWTDSQLDIPESGNGIPDILDEVRWELDFYVRMQRPDGHFMTSAKGHNPTVTSPPSASDEERVYFDCTSPDGNGWSGGGVTIGEATGNAVVALAHAAIVFRAAGQQSIGDGYAAAATAGWNWLDGYSASGSEENIKAAAASAMFRMDPAQATAKAFADAFAWDTFNGEIPDTATPAEEVISVGAWHYLMNASGTASVKTRVRTGVAAALVNDAFGHDGPYGGMFGGPGNGWDWSWGSNRNQALYGSNLLMAAKLGVVGAHTAAEIQALAQKHLHFLLGLNPLNMVYMTNMAAYGGEHSSFHIFHSWFSFTGNDGDDGNLVYNGKPSSLVEPLYPYYPDDNQTSRYGPAPGLVPGGPNWYYDADYTIPNRSNVAYAYRDFSVGCGWNGSACTAASWELTEPDVGYQGPVVLLMSFSMTAP
ncbi:MAG TPA: glycoside hydrolase family 9 protein [Myxococcales bacterium]|nr:glycoside hydrolase family 9 protein [Myxococcales bacterium]